MARLSPEEVDALSREEFVRVFGGVYENSPWAAEAAWEERPFGELAALEQALERAVRRAPAERRLELIKAHPDLAGRAAVAGEITRESAREQSSAGLDRLTPEEHARFTRMNREYRERFGIPFIVCVREHTKESILAAGERRLSSTRERELETALDEICKIARHRLREIVAPPEGEGA
ncbi:Uric acid degradation bifunctional protein [Rubrobacter xylanophilus DSM 9941]|uniref:2-oxo-4-hydroxy-4-carboxy-5-ureidoimidazoline decarboxylase n=1 Tax=Rubrobacter xylanophilus TaxID=49319 RepID=UPI001C63E718|nr:2-oxo-4-hydroxy-4-carboxy-5-ureidoimidazoline decarboxylase [Rubrobacter xylanophilus]QYJ15873.1 Uric acid degradation bifunctional protein [Rubrobacter xylanophilus DSM 9941]